MWKTRIPNPLRNGNPPIQDVIDKPELRGTLWPSDARNLRTLLITSRNSSGHLAYTLRIMKIPAAVISEAMSASPLKLIAGIAGGVSN